MEQWNKTVTPGGWETGSARRCRRPVGASGRLVAQSRVVPFRATSGPGKSTGRRATSTRPHRPHRGMIFPDGEENR